MQQAAVRAQTNLLDFRRTKLVLPAIRWPVGFLQEISTARVIHHSSAGKLRAFRRREPGEGRTTFARLGAAHRVIHMYRGSCPAIIDLLEPRVPRSTRMSVEQALGSSSSSNSSIVVLPEPIEPANGYGARAIVKAFAQADDFFTSRSICAIRAMRL